ncbi:ABC transporter permease [Nakamurella leprariae]|uniref:ABC transporter permease n=1 Tax=Nakamurella leprariae TaxID=2803911 RepID=A0A938YIC3_9ACTN|nr:ABC transporter permease [Nakamurella leprariae]MBM9468862.1 ABC transporter permease [Nakamurella leprariae]
MSTASTLPPVHQYEENTSRGSAIGAWLKGQYALYILLALLIIATITRGSVFWSGTNLTNLLLQMSIIGVVVLAELIVVLTGGIDISVGSALGLAAVIAAGLFGGPSIWLALLVAIVIGGIVGAVNGWLVAYRGLEPFIVTLGMLALARGLVYAYGNGIPIIPEAAATFASFGQTTIIGIPVLAIIWIAAIALIAFLLYRTVWGRRVYAIGSNKEAARASGIPVKRTLWSVYILAGLLVGLGGWMFLGRFAAGTSTAGNLLELEAIAAVVIGGARLSGGYGRVFGAVVGTIIFTVIANLLSLLNVSTFLQDAFRGALILVAVTLATVSFANSRRRTKAATETATDSPASSSTPAGQS